MGRKFKKFHMEFDGKDRSLNVEPIFISGSEAELFNPIYNSGII